MKQILAILYVIAFCLACYHWPVLILILGLLSLTVLVLGGAMHEPNFNESPTPSGDVEISQNQASSPPPEGLPMSTKC